VKFPDNSDQFQSMAESNPCPTLFDTVYIASVTRIYAGCDSYLCWL